MATADALPRESGRRRARARQLQELVLHLAHREVTSMHRWTLLGWAWPVMRQLAQLTVLVFIFSSVVDLGIENYPVFVFSGLIAWAWFGSGVGAASGSLIAQRNLVFQAKFPTVVIPVVAVTVPFVDVLTAIPVLMAMLAWTGDLSPTILLLPPLLVIQLVFMAGVAWLAAACNVFFRDVQNVVLVGLNMLFYLTPVFYELSRVPERYQWVLLLNPLTTLIEAYRDVLLEQRAPDAGPLALVALASVMVAVFGWASFRRLEARFVDEL